MIDYKGIGIRIRDMRKMKKMTQEQLAEAAGVGVTHISHIETGNSVPSLQVMVDIINALDCSADELLCVEIDQARPLVNCWLLYDNLITNVQNRLPFRNISGILKCSAAAEIILMNRGDPYVHDSVPCDRSCGHRSEYLPAPKGSRPDSPRSPALFRI